MKIFIFILTVLIIIFILLLLFLLINVILYLIAFSMRISEAWGGTTCTRRQLAAWEWSTSFHGERVRFGRVSHNQRTVRGRTLFTDFTSFKHLAQRSDMVL
jgi:hypothetical protein